MRKFLVVVVAMAAMTASTVRAEGLKAFTFQPGDGEKVAWTAEFFFEQDVTNGDVDELKRLVASLGRLGGEASGNGSTFVNYGEVSWKKGARKVTASAATGAFFLDVNGNVHVSGTGVPLLREVKVEGPAGARSLSLSFDERSPFSYLPHATDVVMQQLKKDLFRLDSFHRDSLQNMELDGARCKGGLLVFKQRR